MKKLALIGIFLLCTACKLQAAPDETFVSGLELLNQKNYQEAIDTFNLALKDSPENPFIWERRGYAYYCLENYYQSINDYTVAIVLSPTKGSFRMQRALAYMKTNNLNAMQNDLLVAAKLGDVNAQAVLKKHDIAW
jgi:tetratricopeptide (TPR) repeat protein